MLFPRSAPATRSFAFNNGHMFAVLSIRFGFWSVYSWTSQQRSPWSRINGCRDVSVIDTKMYGLAHGRWLQYRARGGRLWRRDCVSLLLIMLLPSVTYFSSSSHGSGRFNVVISSVWFNTLALVLERLSLECRKKFTFPSVLHQYATRLA